MAKIVQVLTRPSEIYKQSVADAQVREGAKWVPLDKCREADPNLPSLVIQPGNGKSIVCYKLEK